MARKVYVSFKAEDMAFKDEIMTMPALDCTHKSLSTPINSTNPDYILQKIREDYLADSTVTIHLIGPAWKVRMERGRAILRADDVGRVLR